MKETDKQNQTEIMKDLRNKVEARLIKFGNNKEEVKDMLNKHFDYVSSTYTTVKAISECIRIIY